MRTVAIIAAVCALSLAWIGAAIPAPADQTQDKESVGEKIKDKAVETRPSTRCAAASSGSWPRT